MRHNTKQMGLSSNVIFDDKYYIFNSNNEMQLCCDKSSIIESSIPDTKLKNKKVVISIDSDDVLLNNQMYNGQSKEYSEYLQMEFFDSSYADTIHSQIATNIDKVKKIIAFYLNTIVFTMNSVAMEYQEDVLSVVNYHISWDNYDPQKSSGKIQSKDDFNSYVYKLAHHNKLFSNVFSFDSRWTEKDYQNCDELIKEHNYDVIRILSMLRNFSIHGTKNEKNSLYIFCSDIEDMKNNKIEKWDNLQKILRENIETKNRILFSDLQRICNTIYKCLYLFNDEKKCFVKEVTYDYIYECIAFQKYDTQIPFAKLARYTILKLANNPNKGTRNHKYYTYLSKQEKKLLNQILYFFFEYSITIEERQRMVEIYQRRKNISDIYNYLYSKEVITFLKIKDLIKYFYIVGKKEVTLYAKSCHCTPFENKNKRGFSTNYGRLDKKMWQQYLLLNNFEAKAQLYCNINKVSMYEEGTRVRNLSFNGKKLRKDKIWSIHDYLKRNKKLNCWKFTKLPFTNEYEKNRYLQIREHIVERVMLVFLYTNKKYYNAFVCKNIKSFEAILDKKDKGWINEQIKTLCYDYDRMVNDEYRYSKERHLFALDDFSMMVFFVSCFLDKQNANMFCESLRKCFTNISYFTKIWKELGKNEILYNDSTMMFSKSEMITRNLATVCSCMKFKSRNRDEYSRIIEYISKMCNSLEVENVEDVDFLHSVYMESKYFNYMIKYVDANRINSIVNNKILLKYAIDSMSIEERNKYEKYFETNAEGLLEIVSDIKGLPVSKKIKCCALIGSLVNNLIKRVLNMNFNYFLAFSFLERDRNMLCRNNKRELKCSDDFINKYANKKYVEEYLKRKQIYDKDCFDEYRNTVAHMKCISKIYDINGISHIQSDFDLFHFLLQQCLSEIDCFQKSEKYSKYLEQGAQYGTPSRELIKIMNLPFAYKPSRYNKLSYRTVFNKMNEKFDNRKKFF